ncbi:MarR family transcriptional regulator [Bacillus halotolerans]|uniref:MarR family transcriptional regulator n=1 Tax=Bacillus halotolerans TaxID=260554 RepID=A0A9Q4EN10_9BACI|nr:MULTISPECIES: MarR family transcriptional regulator [Bacillus]MBU5247471.1 MarR family transcriptional regulator [Bacillus halotolerans]MCC8353258.1 MarR family transcriptional regulator [Bacillus sp. AF23]MCM3355099.1 MarR family transcriptional regulator [Bacillus halotolerans]MCY9186380.1 MarR family transcriptional regulator [Bacillus halotolerans]MCY9202204.1 MarR family transcriptional regulator [Bacillus halotolerans]
MKWHSEFSGPNTSPGFLLWQVTQSWQRKVGKALAEHDLTHVQFVLLTSCKYMIAHGETVTQKKLAGFSQTNIMMVSEVVRTLEKKGFIQRSKNPQDKREVLLSLTETGEERVTSALPIVERIDQSFFEAAMIKENFLSGLQELLKNE